ncbi:cell division protein FtsZ [Oscillatoria amoena NRMC-F 0135]|nr:cell division protein FtsZ [Oscillatoria amoena NRMC-F 0135]
MIEFNRDGALGENAAMPKSRIKVFGVGGAGMHCLDKLIIDGLNQMPLAALDTRAQSLESSIASEKALLGKRIHRGIGAGGDPLNGREAILDDEQTMRAMLEGNDVAILIGSFGGGTATGVIPVAAAMAREMGLKTIVIVTMPYDFEGERKIQDAREALEETMKNADCVLALDYARLTDHIDEIGGLRDAFEAMTELHIHSVATLWRMLTFKNLAKMDFDTLCNCIHRDAQTLFGHGEVRERNVKEALKQVFSSVLMGNNILLRRAESVLVSITGGKEMTMQEVQHILDDVKLRLNPETKIHVSASIHDDFDDRLNISVFAVAPHGRPEIKPLTVVSDESALEMNLFEAPKQKTLVVADKADGATTDKEREKIVIAPAAKTKSGKKSEKQEVIDFQKKKGRFENTEPTVVNGVDLDVPTFMRRKIAVRA